MAFAEQLFATCLRDAASENGGGDDDLDEVIRSGRFHRRVAEAAMVAVEERSASWSVATHEYRSGFTRRLRAAYGDAIDWLEIFVGLCREAGTDIYERREVDLTGEVILDIHARACLAASEVLALLSAGFPMGALATWRTIHETAVYATLLGDHGRDDDSRLSQRWLAFRDVERYRDALLHQKDALRLGLEPFSAEAMGAMKEPSETAVRNYGQSIASPNGWAIELTHPERPHFIQLEAKAGLSHLRGYYKWASHRVHIDGRGNDMNRYTRGDHWVRLVGPTNLGLIDPAELTMSSLWITTNAVLTGTSDEEPSSGEVVAMQLLGLLRDHVSPKFECGEAIVAEAERRIREDEADEPLEHLPWTDWSFEPTKRSGPPNSSGSPA